MEEGMKKICTVVLALFLVFAFVTASIAAKKTGTGKKPVEDTVDTNETLKKSPGKTKGLEPDPWEKSNKVNTRDQQKTR
jgi:hypothetical protein